MKAGAVSRGLRLAAALGACAAEAQTSAPAKPQAPATKTPAKASTGSPAGNTAQDLAAADLLLHTAEYEGLPFALIEAMSMGVPCAISRSVASELPFLNAQNAIFYDDPGRLEHFICHPQALREVGEAARVLVSERFSDHAMAASYEKLYTEQMASSG